MGVQGVSGSASGRVGGGGDDRYDDDRGAITRARQRVGEAVDDAREAVGDAVDGARERVREAVEDVRDTGQAAVERARAEVAETAAAVRRHVEDQVIRPLDAEAQIRALDSDGDSVVYELGWSAQAVARAEGSGRLEVTRNDEPAVDARTGELRIDPTTGRPQVTTTYEVTVAGDLGLGLVGELGSSAHAGASAQAVLRGGAATVLTFQTPEEAARAVDILARAGAASARGGIADWSRELVPPEDAAFLQEHETAIELRGTLAAELAGNLGVGLNRGAQQIAGVGGRSSQEGQDGVRIEHRREPPRVTVFSERTDTIEGSAGAGFSAGGHTDEVGDDRGLRLGAGASGTSRLRVRVEDTYTLSMQPRGEGFRDLATTLRSIPGDIERIRASRETRLTLSQEVRGQVTGLGGRGAGVEADIEGATEAEIERAMAAARRSGALGGVEALAGSQARVEARIHDIRTHGFRINPELSVMGGGVGFTAAAERTDLTTTHIRGGAGDVGAELRARQQR